MPSWGNRNTFTSRQLIASAAAVTLGMVTLSACGSAGGESPAPSDTSSSSPEVSASPSPSSSGFPVEFDASLSSSYSRVAQLGSGADEVTYGFTNLDGRTTINSKSVSVKDLLTVDLKDGSGPVGGFLELKWSDGTVLSLRQSGEATYDSSSKKTNYDTKLEVVGASDKAKGTTGTGTLTGVKSGKTSTTGGSVKITVVLDLVNAPSEITGSSKSKVDPGPTASYNATIAP